MKRTLLFIYAAALIAALPARADLTTSIGLASGDKVAIGGDSITAAKLYSHYLAAYLQLTYPALDLKTYTVARSGSSIGGWATPAPVAPGASSTGLYERYHYPLSPDIVFMMHGQNAGETAAAHVAHYEDELWPGWVDGVSSAKLVILGMHPVQAATDTKSAAAKADAEAAFAAATTGVYASNTFDYMGSQWLANSGNAIDVQQSGVEPSTGTRDTVHPGPAGNVVIAWAVLQGLGETGFVSSATLNAATNTTTAATDCTISNLALTSTGGTFDRLDARLPWAIDESGRTNAVALIPDIAGWQDYSITITGLAAGSYDIKCDGVVIGEATAAELAAGWNMADLTAGPVWQQAQEVLGECRDLEGVDRTTVAWIVPSPTGTLSKYQDQSLASYQTGDQRGSTYFSTMAPLVAAMDANLAELQADAQPVTRTYTITAQAAWRYTAIPYTDWAYDPFTIATPSQPAAWPSAEQSGYYFIEQGHPSASDTADGSDTLDANGKRWGYPARPRATIPASSQYYTQYAAGSVIWIKGHAGQVYAATSAGFSTWGQASQGTDTSPVWIVGDPDVPPVFSNLRTGFYSLADLSQSAKHIIVDGIEWGPWTVHGGCVSYDPGVHHITVRNCSIHDRDAPPSGSGSFFSIGSASATVAGGHTADEYDIHDLVIYDNTFTDNGHGVDWRAGDPDFHGIKGSSRLDAGRIYRVWAVENTATGTFPDSIDGITKSICGTFFQLGDDVAGLGNIDHVFIAGNHVDYVRQSVTGMKRSKHVFSSGNVSVADSLWATFASTYNIKYGTQEGMWVIGNYAANQPGALVARKELDSGDTGTTALIGIIGNIGVDCTLTYESGGIGGWRENGIAFHEMRGKCYVVNNTMDNTTYGVVTAQRPGAIDANSRIHIYNNAFVNMVAGSDPLGGKGISINLFNGTTGNMQVFMENNLMDDLQVYLYGVGTYTTAATLNALSYAENNMESEAGFTNEATNDYSLTGIGAAVNAGISGTYSTNAADDIYEQFIALYDADPDFPGDPRDVWPRDYLGAARVHGSAIDIGAYEYSGSIGAATITLNIDNLNVGTLNIGP